jgi:hypothetical protein
MCVCLVHLAHNAPGSAPQAARPIAPLLWCQGSSSIACIPLTWLQIKLQGAAAGAGQAPQVARLTFVDLAGCERAGRTGNAGVRLK